MKILGLEIKKIEKKDMPRKREELFSCNCRVTDKGSEYLFGLKDSPFSTKKNQAYLRHDGIRIAHGRIHFMWKGDVIVSQDILGPQTGDPLDICGIFGKQKINLT